MMELKRCPLCGAEGKLRDTHGKIRQGWVGCPACSLYINWQIDPTEAVKKWNRRAPFDDGFTTALTADALDLLKYMPEAVNSLAAKLIDRLGRAILFGEADDDQ